VSLNPATGFIDGFRASLLDQPLPWSSIAYSTLFAAVVVVTGAFYFRRVERQFADVL
jgi:lipopolysaccharide transport system permease protein